ncbi:hypothetical protein [Sphingomonas sp. RS2018]
MHVLAWEEAFAQFDATVDRQAIHDQIGKGRRYADPHAAARMKCGRTESNGFRARRRFPRPSRSSASVFPRARPARPCGRGRTGGRLGLICIAERSGLCCQT